MINRFIIDKLQIYLIVIYLFISASYVFAINIIADQEAEDFIKDIAYPILKVARLPCDIRIAMINDNSFNAFVNESDSMFINAGLFTKSNNIEQIASVIAHEIAHIANGHVYKRGSMNNANMSTFTIPLIVASALSLITFNPIPLVTTMGLLYNTNIQIMKYSRSQEYIADKVGIEYLRQLGIGRDGMIEMLMNMKKESRINDVILDTMPYMHTHPFPEERIQAMLLSQSGIVSVNSYLNNDLKARYKRLVAKFSAHFMNQEELQKIYKDQSEDMLYASAILKNSQGDLNGALKLVNQLIAQYNNNPYYFELYGDILFNKGEFAKSINA
ncbi:MAG: M48 family metalloprotease, partial [Proteobacteria bacterium]|nr:M48 family metalloprotease [Pseudomonadota bacterium]